MTISMQVEVSDSEIRYKVIDSNGFIAWEIVAEHGSDAYQVRVWANEQIFEGMIRAKRFEDALMGALQFQESVTYPSEATRR